MTSYDAFLARKQFDDVSAGFKARIATDSKLFDFQKIITRWALGRGRAAIFADTGLGKTAMQVTWAEKVAQHTKGSVLILAPLCVSQQTVREGDKFGVDIEYHRVQPDDLPPIIVTNYEMMENFDFSSFRGIVLDESSILKHQQSKTRQKIIEACQHIPYRLSCTATPSPNDYMELGNQAEFLGIMSASEMLAMFFTHDGGETNKWRLKGHGKTKFWEWLSAWAVVVRKPSDIGFDDEGYNLPGLEVIDHIVESEAAEGELFPTIAQTLQERRSAKRATIANRVQRIADIVNESSEQWVIWCQLNDESDLLNQFIPDAVEVRGSNTIDEKESRLMDFADGKTRVMVTKASIAGFGLNWQHCHNMAFVSISDSFEQYYQAVRRCYRFGQGEIVNVHLVHAESEGAVKSNLNRKQKQHEELSTSMVRYMRDLMKQKLGSTQVQRAEYVKQSASGDGWELYNADCIELVKERPDDSVDFSIFSPPFASLYVYSNSDRDMGNSRNHSEFFDHFKFLVGDLLRITKPGRLCSFHCMNLPTSKFRDGVIGITDFRGQLIRMFTDAGWIYHSEVTIWKNPVVAMQRTKALGLLHKQIKKDSSMSRQGIPDYLVTMRKPGENLEPITHTNDTFPVSVWQEWASPIWMDINASRTLQYRSARDQDDERHICPLQLDVIERAIYLWSNPGNLIFSPFAGIGSEGYVAIEMGRRFLGVELKPSYFELAKRNLDDAKPDQESLFKAV